MQEIDIILTSLVFSIMFFMILGTLFVSVVGLLRDYSSSAYVRRVMKDYYSTIVGDV